MVGLFSFGVVLILPKTERVCGQQFQTDENGRKFFKRAENAVGKEEIARYEQFLLFAQCFQKHIKTRACLGKG